MSAIYEKSHVQAHDQIHVLAQRKKVKQKIYRHLMPLLIIVYIISFIDRSNIGMAQKTMSADLGLSASAFGLGAGLFFLTYAFLEVPSNLMLEKIGARRWIARIMVSWGIISCAMAFISGASSFYVMRLLLGAAEAGLYPGVIYYMTLWFRKEERAKATGLFLLAVCFANVIGSPLGGVLLNMHGLLGFAGWQWLFFIEGIPAIILAVVVWYWLPDNPAQAKWLTEDEKLFIQQDLSAGEQQVTGHGHFSLKKALINPSLILLILIYFTQQFSIYGLIYFLPGIIAHWGNLSYIEIGLLAAVPWLAAAAGGLLLPAFARNEILSRRILVMGYLVMATGMFIGAVAGNGMALAGFSLAAAMFFAVQSIIFSWLTNMMSGRMLAGSIGLLTCLGLCGGFLGPFILGIAEDYTGSASSGLWFAVALLMAGAFLASRLKNIMPDMQESIKEDNNVNHNCAGE